MKTDYGFRILFLGVVMLCYTLPSLLHAQPTYIWDYEHFLKMKGDVNYYPNLRRNIITKAENIIQEKTIKLTDKKVTISGNKHNYESLATYYWKNPNNPQGSYIVKDGEANPECDDYDLPRLKKLSNNLKYLALAYFLTEKNSYFNTYIQQLDTWFIDRNTRMLPNMEYAQFAFGHNQNKGMPGGFIESRYLHDVLESLRLINCMHDIGSSRNRKMRQWMQDFLSWSLSSDTGKKAQKFTNNQAVNYDYVLYDLYLYLGDRTARKRIWNDFFKKRVEPQILSDGRQPKELQRATPFAYSVFNLRIMTNFCLAAKRDGMDTSETAQRLEKAYLFLIPYIGNEGKFPYKDLTSNFKPLETELKESIIRMKKVTSSKSMDSVSLKDIYNFGISN